VASIVEIPQFPGTLQDDSDQLRQMSFRVEVGVAHFDLTERFVSEFEKGILDVRAGMGDYSIGPREDRQAGLRVGELDAKSERLWFWPCFGHSRVVED
jgi:hypothetical protein